MSHGDEKTVLTISVAKTARHRGDPAKSESERTAAATAAWPRPPDAAAILASTAPARGLRMAVAPAQAADVEINASSTSGTITGRCMHTAQPSLPHSAVRDNGPPNSYRRKSKWAVPTHTRRSSPCSTEGHFEGLREYSADDVARIDAHRTTASGADDVLAMTDVAEVVPGRKGQRCGIPEGKNFPVALFNGEGTNDGGFRTLPGNRQDN